MGAPQDIRTRFSHLSEHKLINQLRATRPRGAITSLEATTGQTLRRLARRCHALSEEIKQIDTELSALVNQTAPAMVATSGFGTITTATLLITAGDNPERLHTEASFAALCGTSPIPASSGKTTRYRLNRGGDRQANCALHQIALTRLANDPRTQAYATTRRATGKTTKDILRCLKRAIAREAWHLLTHPTVPPPTDDLRDLRHQRGLTLAQAATHLNTTPARISELERGTRPNTTLATTYRHYLTTP